MFTKNNIKSLEVELDFLSNFDVIFWDFDGVIKDSVEVKAEAFAALFNGYGIGVQKKVREHHLQHGGMSRYEKIPFYFQEYVHLHLSEKEQQAQQIKFKNLVVEKVIESEWVLGVKDYLVSNSQIKQFFLLTGTPQDEIEYILDMLKISSCFKGVIGSPSKKQEGLKHFLNKYNFSTEQCLMIGDSLNDFEAAKSVKIPFLLRITPENQKFNNLIRCYQIRHFEKAST